MELSAEAWDKLHEEAALVSERKQRAMVNLRGKAWVDERDLCLSRRETASERYWRRQSGRLRGELDRVREREWVLWRWFVCVSASLLGVIFALIAR